MLREILETLVPEQSWTIYGINNVTGVFSPSSITKMYGFDEKYDIMWSEDHNKHKQTMKPCVHYTRFKTLFRRGIADLDSWTSLSKTQKWLVPFDRSSSELWESKGQGAIYPTNSLSHPSTDFGRLEAPLNGLPSLSVLDPTYRVPTVDYGENNRRLLIQSSLNAMLPGIRSSASVPNLLYELKDMKTLGRSFRSVLKGFDEVARLRKALGTVGGRRALKTNTHDRTVAKQSLRQVLRSTADGFLQANFNLLPLLSDMAKIQNGLRSLSRDLDDLVRRANSPQKRRFKRILSQEYVNSTVNKTYALHPLMVDTSAQAKREVTYRVREFNAVMTYEYTLPSLREDELVLGAFLDRLGFNLNPTIIWNAIPWTFVVDWFVGVSRWLDQFKYKNIEPTVYITGYSHSIHVVRETRVSYNVGSRGGPLLAMVEEAYDRRVGLDTTLVTSSISWSGLNSKEFLLSSALLSSR